MDDIKIDSEGRVAEVANEIVFILMREDICSLIMDDLGTEEILSFQTFHLSIHQYKP